jgi:hypothetical protein
MGVLCSQAVLALFLFGISSVSGEWRSDETRSYASNSTCDAGDQSVDCPENCVTGCGAGYAFQKDTYICGNTLNPCRPCLPGELCDGSDVIHLCSDIREGMTSDYGSSTEDDCRCRHGELRNGACNTTCDAGLSLGMCGSGETRCFPTCPSGHRLRSKDCATAESFCEPCRGGYWCDMIDYHICPPGMISPLGSSGEGNCTCGGGRVQNGTTCSMCPEGSWCDEHGQHTCPVGTTSNIRSRSPGDCYCSTPSVVGNCKSVGNVTHQPCDDGWAPALSASPLTGECRVCGPLSWCDGFAYHQFPRGAFLHPNYGSRSIEECFCPIGHMKEVGGSSYPCFACPAGSWCDRFRQHRCPNGTTSSPGASSPDECFCPIGHMKEVGGSPYLGILPHGMTAYPCSACPGGSWCDRFRQHRCPKGTTSSPGASRPDECSCYPGYKASDCTSVVSFTVSLPITKAAFSPALQAAYRAAVASSVSCAEGSVVIVSIDETSSGRRRLLDASIEVATDITLPAVVGGVVVAGGGLAGVTSALTSLGVGVGAVSAPALRQATASPLPVPVGPTAAVVTTLVTVTPAISSFAPVVTTLVTVAPSNTPGRVTPAISSFPLALLLVVSTGGVVVVGMSVWLLYRIRSRYMRIGASGVDIDGTVVDVHHRQSKMFDGVGIL